MSYIVANCSSVLRASNSPQVIAAAGIDIAAVRPNTETVLSIRFFITFLLWTGPHTFWRTVLVGENLWSHNGQTAPGFQKKPHLGEFFLRHSADREMHIL